MPTSSLAKDSWLVAGREVNHTVLTHGDVLTLEQISGLILMYN